jgi:hypothetical protein
MQPLDLLLTSLASFYVAYAVSSTHGPFHAFAWLRANVSIGGLLECLVCLSPWAALLFLWLLTTPLLLDSVVVRGGRRECVVVALYRWFIYLVQLT